MCTAMKEDLMKRSVVKAIRTREKNNAINTDLTRHLAYLSHKEDKTIRAVNRDIRNLVVALKQAGIQNIDTSVSLPSSAGSTRSRSGTHNMKALSFPRIPALCGLDGYSKQEQQTANPGSGINRPKSKPKRASVMFAHRSTCRIEPERKTECMHFPCSTPSTYHQFGYPSGIDGVVTTRVSALSANTKSRLYRSMEL